MKRSCAFTGHRPSAFPFGYDETDARCVELQKKLFDTVSDLCFEGYRIFYTGMAEGVDLWAAEAVLRCAKHFPALELHAVIPFRGHERTISAHLRARYDTVLEYASDTVILADAYTPTCYKARNYFLAEQCDALVAVYDPARYRSGTGQTVRRAEALEKRIIHINAFA